MKTTNKPVEIIIMALTIIFLQFHSKAAFSQTKDEIAAPLFDLSFEELMALNVELATKTQQTVSDAPSSITVFTRKEIENMGVNDVYDLLNYVPGYQVTRYADFGVAPRIQARGYAGENPWILVLIDGERVNEISLGSATGYTSYLTTGNVRQVEIIRGPGSALYGSNAFLGVINIVTEKELNELSLNAHSQKGAFASANMFAEVTDNLKVSAFAHHYQDKGFDYSLPEGNTTDPREGSSVNLRLTYRDITLNLRYDENTYEDFYMAGNIANGISWSETTNFYASLYHDWTPSDKIELTCYVNYKRSTYDGIALFFRGGEGPASNDFFAGPYSISKDYAVGADLDYQINNNNHLIAGVGYRKAGLDVSGAYTNYIASDFSDFSFGDDDYLGEIRRIRKIGSFSALLEYMKIYSAYVQYEINLTEQFTLFVGARYDGYSDTEDAISPRTGLIYKAPFHATFKALYGSAFRAPVHNEIYSDDPSTKGNPDLDPETVQTLEFVYIQAFETVETTITYFYNKIEDIIVGGVPVPGSATNATTWENRDEKKIDGLEFGLTAEPVKDFLAKAAYTTILSDEAPDSTYENHFSFILNYTLKKWNFNISGIWRDEMKNVVEVQDDYFLFNSKVVYNLSNSFSLNVSARNIFDKDYYTYAASTQDNKVPNRGREWTAGIQIRF